jgi:hypothetical protein
VNTRKAWLIPTVEIPVALLLEIRDCWETGDLAGAVRDLLGFLPEDPEDWEDWEDWDDGDDGEPYREPGDGPDEDC